jgi:hypothetical protein
MREGSGKGHTEVWEKVLYRDRKSWVRAAAFSFAFSFLFMLGRRLERYDSIPISDSSMWERIFLLWIFVTLCTGLFWSLLETVQEKNAGRAKSTGRSTGRLRHAGTLADSWDALPQMHRRLLVWGALLLVYLVALLAVRPGFFVYDASDELSMFESRAFTTHHPLVHVLLLGGTISLVRKITGSYNAGIFVYCLAAGGRAVRRVRAGALLPEGKRRRQGPAVHFLYFLRLFPGMCHVRPVYLQGHAVFRSHGHGHPAAAEAFLGSRRLFCHEEGAGPVLFLYFGDAAAAAQCGAGHAPVFPFSFFSF